MAAQKPADAVLHLELRQTVEEGRCRVHPQHPVAVVGQVVVPAEQVFGEGVEIERVARRDPAVRFAGLALVLEGHGKARLAGAVMGEDQRAFLVVGGDALAQMNGQIIERGEGSGVGHGSGDALREQLLHQPALVGLQRL